MWNASRERLETVVQRIYSHPTSIRFPVGVWFRVWFRVRLGACDCICIILSFRCFGRINRWIVSRGESR